MLDELLRAADEVLTAFRAEPREPERFHQAYDQFLWVASTAPRESLGQLLEILPTQPYLDLPVSLHVVVARLVGLEYRGNEAMQQRAAGWIACFCTPAEEQAATAGFRTPM